jgi:hypothetical protein
VCVCERERETVLIATHTRSPQSHGDFQGVDVGAVSVVHDEALLMERLSTYLEYWHGARSPAAVGVHEGWKCSYCPYASMCAWRRK